MLTKLNPGEAFPELKINLFDDSRIELGHSNSTSSWTAFFIYRGKHCPLCTKYLNELENYKDKFSSLNINILAISADSKTQLESHLKNLTITYPIGYGLTLEQMKSLGLYISTPRSSEETDHYFSEPAFFVINEHGNIQVVDMSNNPFSRPDILTLYNGLNFIRNNNYPIRGTLKY